MVFNRLVQGFLFWEIAEVAEARFAKLLERELLVTLRVFIEVTLINVFGEFWDLIGGLFPGRLFLRILAVNFCYIYILCSKKIKSVQNNEINQLRVEPCGKNKWSAANLLVLLVILFTNQTRNGYQWKDIIVNEITKCFRDHVNGYYYMNWVC